MSIYIADSPLVQRDSQGGVHVLVGQRDDRDVWLRFRTEASYAAWCEDLDRQSVPGAFAPLGEMGRVG